MGTVIKADFQWNVDPVKAHGLGPGGKVQQTIDNAVIRYCMPYVPFETGTLALSPYRASPPGGGKVIYEGPYARYLYYGEVMGPNIPVFEDDSGIPTRFYSPPGKKKHLTGRPLKYNQDVHPEAGAFWFEHMKASHLQDIIEEAEAVANSK